MKKSPDEQPKPNRKNKGPVSLWPLSFEEAVKAALTTPDPKDKPKKK